jgi:hypothetical protein
MTEKIREIHAALKDALFMQYDRGYVPEWMRITGWSLGININEPTEKPEVVIKLDWHDTRGKLISADTRFGQHQYIPLPSSRIFMDEDWKIGLEAMAKIMIQDASKQWQSQVERAIASGATWE